MRLPLRNRSHAWGGLVLDTVLTRQQAWTYVRMTTFRAVRDLGLNHRGFSI